MKKLLFLYMLTVISVSCTHSGSTVVEQTTKQENTKNQHSKLQNKMIVIGHDYQNHASVAYLLLENGEILIFKHSNITQPLTNDEARVILQTSTTPIYVGAKLIDNVDKKEQTDISKMLFTTGSSYKSEASVVYLQHHDGKVEIFCASSTTPPFTKKQAQMIMADIGSEISY